MQTPNITLDDVLAGKKLVTVEKLDGTTQEVEVRAVPWRTALVAAGATLPGEAMIQTLNHSLPKANATDEWLDSVTTASLMTLFSVALQLKNGVNAVKKSAADRKGMAAGSPNTLPPNAT
jgi:hypothetical protein